MEYLSNWMKGTRPSWSTVLDEAQLALDDIDPLSEDDEISELGAAGTIAKPSVSNESGCDLSPDSSSEYEPKILKRKSKKQKPKKSKSKLNKLGKKAKKKLKKLNKKTKNNETPPYHHQMVDQNTTTYCGTEPSGDELTPGLDQHEPVKNPLLT